MIFFKLTSKRASQSGSTLGSLPVSATNSLKLISMWMHSSVTLHYRLSAMATGFTAAGAHPKDVQTNPTLSERHVHLLLCK